MTDKNFTAMGNNKKNPGKTSALKNHALTLEKLGTSWSPCFSPDGKNLAYVSDVSGSPQVWVEDTEGGNPKRITNSNDSIGHVIWSPDGTRLLLSIAPGGNGGNVQIFTVKPDGTGLKRLSEGRNEANWLGPCVRDANFLPITSNRSDLTSYDSYMIDLETGDYTFVSKNKGLALFLDVTPNGERGLLYQMEDRVANSLFLVDFKTGEKVLISPEKGGTAYNDAKFSKDGNLVFLSANYNRNFSAFCRISIASTTKPSFIETIAENPLGDLEDFALSPDGKIAVLFWNVAGATEIELLQIDSLTREKGPNLPAEMGSFPVFSPDGRLLAFTLSGPALPQNIFLLNLDTKNIAQVSRSNDQDINLSHFNKPKPVTFSSHDGLPISGWLYLPKNFDQPGPMVVSFHGGPEGQERPCFRSDYQVFLNNGLAIFAPNVRGSTGFGKSFAAMDNGPLRFNAIKDIKACIDYVVSHGFADPGRIGIFGASYGGYMVMAGLTSYPDLFAAGVNLYGIVNFETFFRNTHPSMAEISKSKFGDPVSQAGLLRDLSPINRIDKVIAPTLLLHGKNDSNVPLNESEQIYKELKRNEIPTKLVVFSDEGHGFLKVKNRNQCIIETVAWFKNYL